MNVYEPVVFQRKIGGYQQTGQLPLGCRKVRIDMVFDGTLRPGNCIKSGKAALRIVMEAIMTNHATADKYIIVPVLVDPPELTAQRTANLTKARAAR